MKKKKKTILLTTQLGGDKNGGDCPVGDKTENCQIEFVDKIMKMKTLLARLTP